METVDLELPARSLLRHQPVHQAPSSQTGGQEEAPASPSGKAALGKLFGNHGPTVGRLIFKLLPHADKVALYEALVSGRVVARRQVLSLLDKEGDLDDLLREVTLPAVTFFPSTYDPVNLDRNRHRLRTWQASHLLDNRLVIRQEDPLPVIYGHSPDAPKRYRIPNLPNLHCTSDNTYEVGPGLRLCVCPFSPEVGEGRGDKVRLIMVRGNRNILWDRAYPGGGYKPFLVGGVFGVLRSIYIPTSAEDEVSGVKILYLSPADGAEVGSRLVSLGDPMGSWIRQGAIFLAGWKKSKFLLAKVTPADRRVVTWRLLAPQENQNREVTDLIIAGKSGKETILVVHERWHVEEVDICVYHLDQRLYRIKVRLVTSVSQSSYLGHNCQLTIFLDTFLEEKNGRIVSSISFDRTLFRLLSALHEQ